MASSACAGGNAARRPTAQIDSLPSGVVQVTSTEPTLWADSSRGWRVEVAQRYGGEDGTPAELVDPGTLGVDDFGRLYVADRKPAVIRLFDSTGQLVRTIGREGSGPGEFRAPFIAVRGAVLAVHDPELSRTSVFDTSGAFTRSWTSSCCFWDEIFIDESARLYIPTNLARSNGDEPRGRPFTRYTFEGRAIDTLFVPVREDGKMWRLSGKGKNSGDIMMMMNVPFTPVITHTFNPAGGFIYGWTGDFRFVVSPFGRDTARIISRSWSPEPIPDELRRSKVEEQVKGASDMFDEVTLRRAFRLEDVPTTAPAFMELRADQDGNVWARRLIGSDSTKTTFDVFGPDGSWLGGVAVRPAVAEYTGKLFGRGAIYTRTEDVDGRPIIVRLRLVR